MLVRIISGTAVGLYAALMLLLCRTPFYPISCACFGFVAVYEFFRTFGLEKKLAFFIPAEICGALTPFFAYYIGRHSTLYAGCFAVGMIALFLIYSMIATVLGKCEIRFTDMSLAFFGVCYITAAFASMSVLPTIGFAYPVLLILPLFMGAWVTDTMAYFTGMLFGKHKLIPAVSPKKTVEGSIGGTLCCGIAFVLYGLIVRAILPLSPNLIMLAVCGVILSLLSQFGDLFMSIIKRQQGIKDFGNLIPGHGGLLDRFDSILPLAPIMLAFSLLGGNFALFG